MAMRSRKKSISVSRCTRSIIMVYGPDVDSARSRARRVLRRRARSRRCGSSSAAHGSRSSLTTVASADRPLTIEAMTDPVDAAHLVGRHHVHAAHAGTRTFTSHQIRMARAIVAVDRRAISRDSEPRSWRPNAASCSAARSRIGTSARSSTTGRISWTSAGQVSIAIASIIEMLRVAALSTYENRPISTGVLVLGGVPRPVPCPTARRTCRVAASQMESLASIKSFYRLADGVRTVFLADVEGRLLDIIDVDRWSRRALSRRDPRRARRGGVPGARARDARAARRSAWC